MVGAIVAVALFGLLFGYCVYDAWRDGRRYQDEIHDEIALHERHFHKLNKGKTK